VRDDQEKLLDIVEEIKLIEKYLELGRKEYDRSDLIQTWMVKRLENIAEACRVLSKEFRLQHPEIPWEKIIAQRNYLIHEYFAIDLEEVWVSVSEDIPVLKVQIEKLLRK